MTDCLPGLPLFIYPGELLPDPAPGIRPQFNLLEVIYGDVPGLQTIIDVMIVIGDLIGQIDDLSL